MNKGCPGAGALCGSYFTAIALIETIFPSTVCLVGHPVVTRTAVHLRSHSNPANHHHRNPNPLPGTGH
jgi:hypothetical protein